ncbi:MAG: tetratricopeptide repeat protein [Selenomonadaceae bacterium]|nr:tetratricopeptide repeat protein [Selenomonadaceae bacterium]
MIAFLYHLRRGFLRGGCLVLVAAFFLWMSAWTASAEELSPTEQKWVDAGAAISAGRPDVAAGIYGELLEEDPDNAEILSFRGAAYYEAGQMDKAEEDLMRALESIPDAMHPNYYMGMLKSRQGDFSGADGYLEKALALAKDNSEKSAVLDAMGQEAFLEGDYQRAVEQFSAAIEEQESYDAYLHRAIAWMKQDSGSEAEADLSRLTELYPDVAEPYHQRGICRGIMGKYNAALEDFTKAIEMEPKNAVLYCDRGYTYACKKNFPAAVEDYTRALELDPRLRLAYANRALAYEKMKKKDLAAMDRELLEKLMEFEEG